jgi:hypothetical protein
MHRPDNDKLYISSEKVVLSGHYPLSNHLRSHHSRYTAVLVVIVQSDRDSDQTAAAAIKACYVSFTQIPRRLSQAYPLIYHRLNRLFLEGGSSNQQ